MAIVQYKLKISSIFQSLFLGISLQLAAQSGPPVLSLLDEMNKQEVIDLTIEANLDSVLANRNTVVPTEGTFSFKIKKGASYAFQVELKARGRFRRALCEFPPLKLNFPKKELRAAGLKDLDEFKLVTFCLENNASNKNLVLKEYLVYKLYNVITPLSYRVQLARITIRDTNNKGRKINTWGFLIEDDKEFTARNDVKECECLGQTIDKMSLMHERMASVFQFMVGNTDWNIIMLRNLKLMEIANGKLAPVPYDFDFSSIVGAPYRRPNQDVQQSARMERVFMGMSKTANELRPVTAYFISKKRALLNIIQEFRYLDTNERAEMVQYLESFFAMIENNERLEDVYFTIK